MENYLLLGSVIFFGIIMYSFKMRQRMYNNILPCNITYMPDGEDILDIKRDKMIGGNNFKKRNFRDNKYERNIIYEKINIKKNKYNNI
jgi:hypothetical protein